MDTRTLPQGEGRRCYGYLSDDGRYAHCTRAEHAGGLERNKNSDAFAHCLQGDCGCGVTHGEPAPVRPLPGGSQDAPSVSSYRDPRLGQPSQLWPYRYADGEVAGYVARWDRPGGGKEVRPLVLRDGRWCQKGFDRPRPLYNLPELWERPDAPVLVVEGEKTSDAAGRLFASHVPTTSMGGAKAPRFSDWKPLEGREVVIWPDNDGDGQQYAEAVAALVLEAGASSARVVKLPEGIPAHWDLADPVPDGVDVERLLASAGPVAAVASKPGGDGDEDSRRTASSGDRLLRWASDASELFCDGETTFADVWMAGHRETLPVRSVGFRRWLRRLYKERTGKGATQEAIRHAEENLDAQAAGAGQRRVCLRTATYAGKLYIDLCDDAWRVVEVDAEGWRVLSDHPEVRFRRPKTARPLPGPATGDAKEGIDALRQFLNIGDGDFVLCVAWLLASLRDTGPYPLLVLTGEEGSAKSTAARLFRSLVDPALPPSTGTPRSEQDAAIAARNRHVLAYDNVSRLQTWLSDMLCRIATGEGYATRALYTDDEEAVIEASRPVILTGIENPVVRGDLADRSISIRLSRIADADRRTEAELLAAFDEARPIIFGALLDGLAEGLQQYDNVRLQQLPRMADFCRWAVACEGAYWAPGTFRAAYGDAQAAGTEDVLEASPIGPALRQFLEGCPSFDGTAAELLDRLNELQQEGRSPKSWPSNGAETGKHLTRLAPSLRKLGYTAERTKTKSRNLWRLESPQVTGG